MTRKKPEAVHENPVLERMWNRMNINDMNFVAAVVGPTGSGKSLTTASLCMALDPSYSVENVCWEPIELLEEATKFDEYNVGDMMSWEEGGVGADARQFWKAMNQAIDTILQTWREQNRGLILNLPSLDLIDKRIRKRLHYVFIVQRRNSDSVVLKVLRVVENKTEGGISFRYPIIEDEEGQARKIQYIKVGPPPEPFIEAFRKEEKDFKHGKAEEKYENMKEELGQDDAWSVADIADDIIDSNSFSQYVEKNGSQRYLNKDKLYLDYEDKGISKTDVAAVKSILYEEKGKHEEENWV